MGKIPPHIASLIGKELRGKLTEAERDILEEWYTYVEDTPEREDLRPSTPRFGRLLSRLRIANTTNLGRVYLAWAAALFLAVMWIAPNWLERGDKSEKNAVEIRDEFERIVNPIGVRRTITLSDGSSVYLNGGSTLIIPHKFSQNRQLWLEGEAYFDVQADSLSPFLVHAGGIETRVLGTSFTVSAFEDGVRSVVVRSGKVAVKDTLQTSPPRELTANQALEITSDLGVEAGNISTINPETAFAWVQGVLIFRDQPITSVVQQLERWYGLETVDVTSVNTKCRITGTYPQMALKEIMESIAYATGIKYELNGKKLTIRNGDC